MSEKVMIGGAPSFENPFSHCTFLGRYAGYDLYLTNTPGKDPDVLARSGDEPGDYVEGLQLSYGENKPLTAARRIAEYKKLLPMNPVKAMWRAYEAEDVGRIKKALVSTSEYATLKAFEEGRVEEANQLLDQLVSDADMVARYPDSALERLLHVDMVLYVMGKYLGDVFSPQTYFNVTAERIRALGGVPKTFTA
jgi:hypothetical protein